MQKFLNSNKFFLMIFVFLTFVFCAFPALAAVKPLAVIRTLPTVKPLPGIPGNSLSVKSVINSQLLPGTPGSSLPIKPISNSQLFPGIPGNTLQLKSVSNGVGRPSRLMIPAIGVNAAIEQIGLTPSGAVGVPEGAVNVSWFSQSPRPGQVGSAVISGHYGIWKNGNHSVFDRLPLLKIGDTLSVVDENGITHSFAVQDMRVYGKDEVVPQIFNRTGTAYLNIITCYGTYLPNQKTYSHRLVVFAQLRQ